MNRRVVVTGIGLVSSLGIGTSATWAALLAGTERRHPHHQVRRHRVRDADRGRGQGLRPAAVHREEGRQEDGPLHPVRDRGRRSSRWTTPKLTITAENAPNVGVFIGSGIGGFITIEREHEALLEGGPRKISPFFIPSAIINLAAGQVSIRFGAKGPNSATCTACSASAHAIGDVVRDHPARRRRRDDRRRLRGGHHADERRRLRRSCARCRRATTSRRARSRPFDKDRDGFVIGEGAGVVVLEELEHAQAPRRADLRRGRRLRHVGRRVPHDRAVGGRRRRARARWRMAIRKAGIAPDEVDYINAHGTSTPYNDRLETLAIKSCFGDHAHKLAISSTKSMTGHLLGAAGGLEAGITALAVHHQVVPPTINLDDPDPECDLDYVPHTEPRDADPLRAVELLRLRRHERGAAVQEIRAVDSTATDSETRSP